MSLNVTRALGHQLHGAAWDKELIVGRSGRRLPTVS